MKHWLENFFLGFFKNKYSKEWANRSFWNAFLSLFLSVIVLSLLFTSGFLTSYDKHYNDASTYQTFVHNAFYKKDDHIINLKVNSKNNSNYLEGIETVNNQDLTITPINSFKNSEDATKYGNNLIIDLRETSDILVEFELTFYGDDETASIDFDTYASLDSTSAYTNYKYVPTNNEIDVNDKINNYKVKDKSIVEYLNENATDSLKTIQENSEYTDDKKNIEIYKLYLQTYYKTDSFTLFSSSTYYLPTIKYYYETEYTQLDSNSNLVYNNFLIILKDEALVAFNSDKNVEISYLGSYANLSTNFNLIDSTNVNNEEAINENIDSFMKNVFTTCSSLSLIQRIIIVFRNVPFLVIVTLFLALFVWLFNKFSKQSYGERFFGSFKIVYSYLLFSSIVGGLLSFALSFVKDTSNSMLIGFATMILCLIIRVIILMLIEYIKYRRNPLVAVNTNNESNYTDKDFGNNLNLSSTENGTKVIINENSNEDDEKMELM